MTEPPNQAPHADAATALIAPPKGPWGQVRTPLAPDAITDRVRALSRRGKLPGFMPQTPDGLFVFSAFGAPLDYVVTARAEREAAVTILTFLGRMQPRLPLIMAIVTVLSIWPGEPITDSLIRSYFQSYTFPGWVTWAWYLPLTVVPLPFMLIRMCKNSARSAYAHAIESIAIIEEALAVPTGTPVPAPSGNGTARVASPGDTAPHPQHR